MSDTTNANPVSRLLGAIVGAILALRAGQSAAGGLTPAQDAQLEESIQGLQALQAEVTTDEGRIGAAEVRLTTDEASESGDVARMGAAIDKLNLQLNGDGTDANPGALARITALEEKLGAAMALLNGDPSTGPGLIAQVDGLSSLADGYDALAERVKTLEEGEQGLNADADAAGEKLTPPDAGTTPAAVVVTPNVDVTVAGGAVISAGTPTIVTSNSDGAPVLTPVDTSTVTGPVTVALEGLTVSADGVPTVPGGSAVSLGDSAAAPDGHPTVTDLAADGHPVVATVPAAETT